MTSVDTSPNTMGALEDMMYMLMPVNRLEIELHSPIEWDVALTDFLQTNSFLSGLRASESAPPDVVYFGLVFPCVHSVGGAAGAAIEIPPIPPLKGDASVRVATGIVNQNLDFTGELFVHEVAHTMGRGHVRCTGDEAFVEVDYPFPNATLDDTWGYGVRDFRLRDPNFFRDYMSYCNPGWVSPWSWQLTSPVLSTFAQWEAEGGQAVSDPDELVLMGFVDSAGAERWMTVPGSVRSQRTQPSHRVRFYAGAVLVADQPAETLYPSHGTGYIVRVPLPTRFDHVTRIVRSAGGRTSPVVVAPQDMHHKRLERGR